MRVPNLFRLLKRSARPQPGHPERASFSMGERPIPGQEPEPPSSEKKTRDTPLSKNLDDNLKTLKDIFHVPESSDVVFREFTCGRPF